MNYREHNLMGLSSSVAMIVAVFLNLNFNLRAYKNILIWIYAIVTWNYEGNFFPDLDQPLIDKSYTTRIIKIGSFGLKFMGFILAYFSLLNHLGSSVKINILPLGLIPLSILGLTIFFRQTGIFKYEAISHRFSFMHNKLGVHLVALVVVLLIPYLDGRESDLSYLLITSEWSLDLLRSNYLAYLKTNLAYMIPICCFYMGLWGHYIVDMFGFLDLNKGYSRNLQDVLFSPLYTFITFSFFKDILLLSKILC